MADDDNHNCSPPHDSFFARAEAVIAVISALQHAVMKDGFIAAAGRQGAGEVGHFLKAFPDSVQHDEPGTLWHPTQGEVAAARRDDVHGNGQNTSLHQENATTPGDSAAESAKPEPPKSFVEREMERRQKNQEDGNADNDQNERAKGRSLPDEQRGRSR